jgi:hypothetical protein
MKIQIFWDVTPCRQFEDEDEGTTILWKIGNSSPIDKAYISRKIWIFINRAMRTSNLAVCVQICFDAF